MNDNINQKLMNLINDPAVRNNPKLQSLIKSAEGKKLASGLSSAQKQNLLNAFSKMNAADVKNKLGHLNADSLKGMSADQIAALLKNL